MGGSPVFPHPSVTKQLSSVLFNTALDVVPKAIRKKNK